MHQQQKKNWSAVTVSNFIIWQTNIKMWHRSAPLIVSTQQHYGKGKCYICKCSCNFTCTYGNCVNIQVQIEADKKKGGAGIGDPGLSKIAEAQLFLNQSVGSGKLAADSTRSYMKVQMKDGNLQCKSRNEMIQVIEEHDHFCTSKFHCEQWPNFGGTTTFWIYFCRSWACSWTNNCWFIWEWKCNSWLSYNV